jgi:hypothetical protein
LYVLFLLASAEALEDGVPASLHDEVLALLYGVLASLYDVVLASFYAVLLSLYDASNFVLFF